MDGRVPKKIATIVKKLKQRAGESPWIPFKLVAPEHRHNFPDGLSICFTIDILPVAYMNKLARLAGTELPEGLGEDSLWWHLSITRLAPGGPSPEEISLWRRAFFKEEPTIEVPGLIIGANARHIYWRAE